VPSFASRGLWSLAGTLPTSLRFIGVCLYCLHAAEARRALARKRRSCLPQVTSPAPGVQLGMAWAPELPLAGEGTDLPMGLDTQAASRGALTPDGEI